MSAPFRLGITGPPGAGKSAVARMFGELGAAVFDADEEVRRLYAPDGVVARELSTLAPEAVAEDGSVDRRVLRRLLLEDAELFRALEAFVHPLVADARRSFLQQAAARSAALAAMEIPLLFEIGAEAEMDAVLLVDAPRDVRLARLRRRPGFSEALLRAMEARQLPLPEKRRRADHLLDTGAPPEQVRQQVLQLWRRLTASPSDAQA